MSLREEQCNKVCRILDDVLANRPTERDSLIVAVQLAFEALSEPHWIPVTEDTLPEENRVVVVRGDNPCNLCCNAFLNRWTAKDDEIKVGDEVEWDNEFGDRFVVTRIYQPYGQKEQCDGIGDDGDVCRAVLIENLVKTGRHFNVEEILEEMRT